MSYVLTSARMGGELRRIVVRGPYSHPFDQKATLAVAEQQSAAVIGTGALTFTLDAGSAVDDLLVVIFANDWNLLSTLQTPTGTAASTWALRDSFDGGSNLSHIKVFTAPVTTAGAQTVICTDSDPQTEHGAGLWRIPGGAFDVADHANGTSSVAHAAPTLTPATTNEIYCCLWCNNDGGGGAYNYTYPGGAFVAATERDVGTSQTYGFGYELITSGAATGTRTATASTAHAWCAAAVLVQPVAVSVEQLGDATLAATATIGAGGFTERITGASLAATATTTTAGAGTRLAAAAVASTATVATAGAVTTASGASVAGTAAITAAAAVTRITGASLAGTATVTAAATQVATSGASLTGSATVAAAAAVTRITGASLASSATITTTGFVARSSTASLAGTATVTTAGFATRPSGASLAATATITAAAGGIAGQATLAVTATITAVGRVTSDWCAPVGGTTSGGVVTGDASLAATAAISAAGAVTRIIGASLAGIATISCAGFVERVTGAVLTGTATVTAAPAEVERIAAASLAVTAVIDATALVVSPVEFVHAGTPVDHVQRYHAGAALGFASVLAGVVIDRTTRRRAGAVVDHAAAARGAQPVDNRELVHAGTPE